MGTLYRQCAKRITIGAYDNDARGEQDDRAIVGCQRGKLIDGDHYISPLNDKRFGICHRRCCDAVGATRTPQRRCDDAHATEKRAASTRHGSTGRNVDRSDEQHESITNVQSPRLRHTPEAGIDPPLICGG